MTAEESSAARTENLNKVRTSPEQSPTGDANGLRQWRFGPFVLDRVTRELTRDGERVHLAKRPFDVLEHLVAERPRLVARTELLQRFWAGKEVYEEALTRCVSSIRKALDDRDDPPRYLETRWNDGYRFVADVALTGPVADPVPTANVELPAEPAPASEGMPPPVPPPLRPSRWVLWTGLAAAVLVAILFWVRRDPPGQPPPMEQIRRVAVLPLAVAGIDTQFVDGINEELVQTVSRIEGLTLIARGSVAQSAADSADPVAIGKALGVQALLTGTVRRTGEHTVVALRLLSAADASILWSYDAQYDPQEITGSQGDIAAKLAMHLSARLRTAVPKGPRDPATYALYLRARHYWNQRTAASLHEAIRLFEQALAVEPNYAEAQVGLAETWLLMPMYANTAPFDSHPKARAAAEAALRLNPESSRAHMVLAVVSSQFDWDWPAADEHFRRAIALDPNNATAYQWRGESYCYRRQFGRCEADLREALALDPLSPILVTAQGIPARFSGDTAKARRIFAAALQKHPNFVFADFQLGLVAVIDQRWDEAIERLERVQLAMGPVMGGAPLAFAYARAGRADDALRIRHDLERLSAHQYVAPLAFSDIAMGLGDRELAFAWLARAMAVHDDFMVTVGVDHHHFDLHDDGRFQDMMRRVGTPL